CTMTIKQILTNNWGPKLVCLILASALWYLISQTEGKNPSRPDRLMAPTPESKPQPTPTPTPKPSPTPTPKPTATPKSKK
ncbi:MAG: hypothetical protein ACOYMS_06900, partial [Terrimicrobiaceae bacterium]